VKVYVTNIQDDSERLFEGTDAEIERQLLFAYPWLRSKDISDRGDLEGTLEHLDTTQMYSVSTDDGSSPLNKSEEGPPNPDSENVRDQLGYRPHLDAAFRAARFLSGRPEVSPEAVRAALWENDGDPSATALLVYGLEVSPENLKALKAVQAMEGMKKAESVTLPIPDIAAAHSEGNDVADEVRRAFNDHFVFEVTLSGKHSDGTLLAHDEKTGHAWLLKPGSGGQSSAAGANEDPSTQAAREALFYHVAKTWGLYDSFPRAELLLLNGKQFAALRFLGQDFKTLGKLEDTDPSAGRRVFAPYLNDGRLHEWAVLYFILGETDAHAQNCLVNADGLVQFIDHGAAIAGSDFDPANDHKSFVPCFLRAWGSKNFNNLPVEKKLASMPTVSKQVGTQLTAWLNSIHADELEAILYRYGSNPAACLDRLAKVKTVAAEIGVDAGINRLWVTV